MRQTELHLERLQERLVAQRRRVAAIERILAGPNWAAVVRASHRRLLFP